jgi:hypothetical protein
MLRERLDDIKALQNSERALMEQVKAFESRTYQWKSREDELLRELVAVRKQLATAQEEK